MVERKATRNVKVLQWFRNESTYEGWMWMHVGLVSEQWRRYPEDERCVCVLLGPNRVVNGG